MKKGWEIKKFEDCIDLVKYSNKILSKNYLEVGLYPIISQESELINGYWNKYDDVFKISKPIIVFGDHTKVIKYIDFDFVLGADGVKILIPKSFLYSKYFYYYLQSIKIRNLGYARHYKLLKDNFIAHPTSIKEQEEIVEKLDKGFELIDSLKETAKKNLDNAKELFQSVLREELSPKEGWERKTLGGVSNDISYGFTSKSSLYKGNAKYLRITDISQPIIDWDNVPYCEVSSEEFEKYKLIEGDLVIARTGATTGFNKIIKKDVNSVFASYLIRFRLDKSIVFPNLIGYCLQSKEWYDYIKIISSGRAAQPGANSKQLSVFNLSFPKSIKEQEEIVNRLDRIKGYCEELEGNYKRVMELCEELKQGLLREAFSY